MGKLSEDFPHTSRIPACQWVYYRILNSLQLANHGYPHWRSTLNKTQAETGCQGGNGRAACLWLTLLREQDRLHGMHEINMRKRKNGRNAAATHIALCNVAFWSLKNKSRFHGFNPGNLRVPRAQSEKSEEHVNEAHQEGWNRKKVM